MTLILKQHNWAEKIGHFELDENDLLWAHFDEPISIEDFWKIFPTAGARFLFTKASDKLIQAAQLEEFSFLP